MERTNDKLAAVLAELDTLIEWANADREASLEQCVGGKRSEQYVNDNWRANRLSQARDMIAECVR